MSARVRNRNTLLAGLSAADAERRALALDVLDAALYEVDPAVCTQRALQELRAAGTHLDGCTVFAIGKAARGMAEAALNELDVAGGIVLGFEEGPLGPLRMLAGRHPVPADHAADHGNAILQLARSLGEGDKALVLMSGGGSALLELPAPGLTIADMQETTRALLACGAEIAEVNAVRSALSQVKGGGLARALAPADVTNVVLSDVVGSPLHSIASGPTVMPKPHADLPALLARYDLASKLPANVLAQLRKEREPVNEAHYAHVRSVIAADNHTAQRAMLRAFEQRGIHATLHEAPLLGEAREQGAGFIAEALSSQAPRVGGGETTVTLRGSGRGGRNQELVLGAAQSLGSGLFASMGTDGIDGACDDAGMLLDPPALARAAALGIDIEGALASNDSNRVANALGCALHTGRTGTNVTDVCLYVP